MEKHHHHKVSDANIQSSEKNESILHKDVDHVLKKRLSFSVFNLFLLLAILCITAFFAGTQTNGMFSLFSRAAMFRTGLGAGGFTLFSATPCVTEGAADCIGSDLYKCQKDSTGALWYKFSMTCSGDTPICDENSKKCIASEDDCNGQEYRCQNKKVYGCNGTVWGSDVEVDCSGTGYRCKSDLSGCDGSAENCCEKATSCTPGKFAGCDSFSNDIIYCDNTGYPGAPEACPENQVCSLTAKDCVATDNQLCNGNLCKTDGKTLRLCDSVTKQWAGTDNCEFGCTHNKCNETKEEAAFCDPEMEPSCGLGGFATDQPVVCVDADGAGAKQTYIWAKEGSRCGEKVVNGVKLVCKDGDCVPGGTTTLTPTVPAGATATVAPVANCTSLPGTVSCPSDSTANPQCGVVWSAGQYGANGCGPGNRCHLSTEGVTWSQCNSCISNHASCPASIGGSSGGAEPTQSGGGGCSNPGANSKTTSGYCGSNADCCSGYACGAFGNPQGLTCEDDETPGATGSECDNAGGTCVQTKGTCEAAGGTSLGNKGCGGAHCCK